MSNSAIKHLMKIVSLEDYSKKKFLLLDNDHCVIYILLHNLKLVELLEPDYTWNIQT